MGAKNHIVLSKRCGGHGMSIEKSALERVNWWAVGSESAECSVSVLPIVEFVILDGCKHLSYSFFV